MKKHLPLTILLLIIFFISCSKDDTPIEEGSVCKVLGTNGTNPTSLVQASNDINTDIVYLTQYDYDSENKLSTRTRYESPFYIGTDLKDTDNLTYDSNDRIHEISTYNRVHDHTAVKVFEYENSNTLPSKLTRYTVDESEESPLLFYIETFTYNNQNQLISIKKNYREDLERNPVETSYQYNSDGNLTEIKAISNGNEESDNWTSIETFENYDTERNPLKGLPFSDVRGISESNNNYFKYSKKVYNSYPSGTELDTILPSEYNSYEFEPTSSYYNKLATYQCEE